MLAEGHLRNGNLLQKKASFSEISKRKKGRKTESVSICQKATLSLLGNHLGEGHLRNGNLLQKKGSFSEISEKEEERKEDGNRQHLLESSLKRLVAVTVEFDNCQTTLPRY
ncbi:hypothetical protein CEXT_52971 [Caerostris extrusa]|uniref:Uncharacterized protein n=1 Tax=Caerostris extrusa TaxID=172846 RepID=A0AAV4NWN6_CAEEX|nr:hypothetical protein CEXT_52971 [Caerostris extrusa]